MADLRRVPAEITVFAGAFGPFPAAQPLVFAHLWDVAPDLDLDHVEVIPATGAEARLAVHFDASAIDGLKKDLGESDTIVLILPAAYEGLSPPDLPADRLRPMGRRRGFVRHLVQQKSDP